jgi:hypothetical protein
MEELTEAIEVDAQGRGGTSTADAATATIPVSGWMMLRQTSELLGPHTNTVRRWVDSGAIGLYWTLGGHRRVALRGCRSEQKQTHPPEFRRMGLFFPENAPRAPRSLRKELRGPRRVWADPGSAFGSEFEVTLLFGHGIRKTVIVWTLGSTAAGSERSRGTPPIDSVPATERWSDIQRLLDRPLRARYLHRVVSRVGHRADGFRGWSSHPMPDIAQPTAEVCVHHWMLPPPGAKDNRGVCNLCGAEKEFADPSANSSGHWMRQKGRQIKPKT